MFLALCIVCVSGYIGQVLNVVSAVSSFFGMVILAALIYYFTMWLTGGNELVTGIFMFLAPACEAMIHGGGRAIVGQDGSFGQVFTSASDMIVHLPCDRRYRTG